MSRDQKMWFFVSLERACTLCKAFSFPLTLHLIRGQYVCVRTTSRRPLRMRNPLASRKNRPLKLSKPGRCIHWILLPASGSFYKLLVYSLVGNSFNIVFPVQFAVRHKKVHWTTRVSTSMWVGTFLIKYMLKTETMTMQHKCLLRPANF